MPKIIFNGEPGETWVNETGKVAYQLLVNWSNSCGLCGQYDHAIGPSWPIPFHRGCRCRQILVVPGGESRPFVDFQEKIAELNPLQQSRVVGRSNLTLIEEGVVKWSDVVTPNRVRDFREVVAREKLSVKAMVGAGVSPRYAVEAHATVHTPAHELAARQRQDLLDKLLAKGVQKDQVRRALAERLAARVGVGAGPSGPGALPVVPTTPKPKPKPMGAGASPAGPAPPPRRISAKRPPAPRPATVARGDELAFAPPVQQAYLESLGVLPEVARAAAGPTAPLLPGRPIAERIAAYAEGHERVKQLQAIGSDYARLRAEMDARRSELEAATATHASLRAGPEKRAALAAKNGAIARLGEASQAFYREEREVRERAQDVLKAPGRMQIGLTSSADKLSDYQYKSIAEGLRWTQRNMVHPKGVGEEALRVNTIPIPAGLPQRSACGPQFMWVADSIGPQTMVHETGHHLDFQVPGFREASRAFLAHRVGDETPILLNEAMEGRGKFGADEFGRKDRFDEAFGDAGWYVGKDYGEKATEITAMGLEKMFTDPVGFAQTDPEYATFILGLMHGPLR